MRLSYYIINGITMYRLASAPFLLLLAAIGEIVLFKWFLVVSFLTDAVDGPLSRKYEVSSVFGSRLDSVADDATVFASTIALWIIHPGFVRENWMVIAGLFALFGIQATAALIAYKKVTSFHTHMAKTAAVAQAAFFIAIFFNLDFVNHLFVIAATITGIQLVEEIALVVILREWTSNVKGLYWVWRSKSRQPRREGGISHFPKGMQRLLHGILAVVLILLTIVVSLPLTIRTLQVGGTWGFDIIGLHILLPLNASAAFSIPGLLRGGNSLWRTFWASHLLVLTTGVIASLVFPVLPFYVYIFPIALSAVSLLNKRLFPTFLIIVLLLGIIANVVLLKWEFDFDRTLPLLQLFQSSSAFE